MKKITTGFLLLTLNFIFCQSFEVTPEGLRDKAKIENNYIVIEAEGMDTNALYESSLKYINEVYKNPSEVIKAQEPGEYIRFDTYAGQFTTVKNGGIKLDVSTTYTIELRFKDSRAKFEITDLNITADNGGREVFFQGSKWKGYPIYDQKGELRLPDTKADIEELFNSQVNTLKGYLLQLKSEKDDW